MKTSSSCFVTHELLFEYILQRLTGTAESTQKVTNHEFIRAVSRITKNVLVSALMEATLSACHGVIIPRFRFSFHALVTL